MGNISIVYGNIIGAGWSSENYHKLQRLNIKAIEALPGNDDPYPWITRNMFLVPDPDTDRMYRDQVIVFGASYKSVEYEWDQWLEKFEAILKQLYWLSATIHLEAEIAGHHKYEWIFDHNQLESRMSNDPQPTSMWTFTGGPRKFFENVK